MKSTMKRILAVALAVLMTAALFSGCASSGTLATANEEQIIPTISANPSVELESLPGRGGEENSSAAEELPAEADLLPEQDTEAGSCASEPEENTVSAPREVYDVAGFDFSFPAEIADSLEYAHTTPTSILVHYSPDEFDGHVDFVKFLDEDNAYDSIRGDFYYYEHEIISVHDVEVNVLSMVNEESGTKSKTIAYWKVNEWCYEMNTHFAPNCNFDAILERFIMISLDQK